MKLLIAFLISVLSIAVARADLLIEPAVGYNIGKFDDTTVTGLGYGGRLGYTMLGFQLGVDYLQSSMSDSDSNKYSTTDIAAFVGYRFPVLFKVYAAYIFSATAEVKGDDDFDFEKGSGQKVGLGFTGIPFVDINFEYRTVSYKEYTAAGVTNDEDVTKSNAFFVGVSVPLTF